MDLEEELRRIWRIAQRYASGPCSCGDGRCATQCIDGKVLVDYRTAEIRGHVSMWTSFLTLATDEPVNASLESWRAKIASHPGCLDAIFMDCPACEGSGKCTACGGSMHIEEPEYSDTVLGIVAIALIGSIREWANAGDFHRVAWASEWFQVNLIKPSLERAGADILQRSVEKMARCRDEVVADGETEKIRIVGEPMTESEIDKLLAEED